MPGKTIELLEKIKENDFALGIVFLNKTNKILTIKIKLINCNIVKLLTFAYQKLTLK